MILREHPDWVVVGKPAPLLMHPTGKSDEVTLVGLLRGERPGEEFFLVNRLDRETSGCVLVAKSSGVARKLGKKMARREVHKEYCAMVHGWPEWDERRVEVGLRRMGEFAESEIWVRQAVHEEGKESVTTFKVEERLEDARGRFSRVKCYPETGRTHQIRVHLEWLGHAIVGDKIYGGDGSGYLEFLKDGWTGALAESLLLDRQALHASRLQFRWEDELIDVSCEMPKELRSFCVA